MCLSMVVSVACKGTILVARGPHRQEFGSSFGVPDLRNPSEIKQRLAKIAPHLFQGYEQQDVQELGRLVLNDSTFAREQARFTQTRWFGLCPLLG